MKYPIGKLIEFTIYGTIVEGEIVKDEGEKVRIKTTVDFIKENIGKEQTINKSYRHCLVNKKNNEQRDKASKSKPKKGIK